MTPELGFIRVTLFLVGYFMLSAIGFTYMSEPLLYLVIQISLYLFDQSEGWYRIEYVSLFSFLFGLICAIAARKLYRRVISNLPASAEASIASTEAG